MNVRACVLALLITTTLSGCDDQIKRVPIFKTMSWQSSVEAFEEEPRTSVSGTMPIDGARTYDLLMADSVLTSPIGGTESAHRVMDLWVREMAPLWDQTVSRTSHCLISGLC